MIDYEKLKIAYELANKLYELTNICTIIRINIFFDGNMNSHEIYSLCANEENFEFYLIDDLITRIQKLIKPISKYTIGQIVWRIGYGGLKTNTPLQQIIEDIDYESDEKYLINDYWYRKEELYLSKEELIEAQIKYWSMMCICDADKRIDCPKCSNIKPIEEMNPEFEGEIKGFKCEHEDNGLGYAFHNDDGTQFSMMKCKKCGEFYK